VVQEAGAFLYTDRPAHIIAAEGGLFVHVNEAGPYVLRHPQIQGMKDLFSGLKIRSGDTVNLTAKQVCLFVPDQPG